MLKTFKYRLYPNKAQERLLSDTCFLCSLVYNACLAERIDAYENEGRTLSAFDQIKTLPHKKTAEPRPRSVYSQVLQDAPRRVGKAFNAFSRRVKAGAEKTGFPRFRSARRYDSVALEDLRPANMPRHRRLSKSVADASWGVLRQTLEWKALEWGREVVAVDPRHTSQACSRCVELVPKSLSERGHVCPDCGLRLHRDVNAAFDVLNRSGLGRSLQASTWANTLSVV